MIRLPDGKGKKKSQFVGRGTGNTGGEEARTEKRIRK